MSTEPPFKQRVEFAAHDGRGLVGYRFEPVGQAVSNVVIAPAMAISQGFYSAFAQWLAREGHRAWTFDYRGTGESMRSRKRGGDGSLDEWCRQDYDGMLAHVGDLHPQEPLLALGHSFGGQCAPLLPSRHRLAGLVNIAVGSGAMRHNTPRIRRSAPMLWYLLVPVLCPLFGYFPGARLGVIGDLPNGAIRQWRRWCLSPDYLLGAEPGAREAYGSATYPVLGLSFSDDELLLESGSRMLHEAYSTADVDYRLLTPQQVGLPRVGHFGFFRPFAEATLWPQVRDWLHERAGVHRQLAQSKASGTVPAHVHSAVGSTDVDTD